MRWSELEYLIVWYIGAAESVLVPMAPKARGVITRMSPNDFSNQAFLFGTAREIEIGMGLARAHRVTCVGQLGWELYVSSDQTAHVWRMLQFRLRETRPLVRHNEALLREGKIVSTS